MKARQSQSELGKAFAVSAAAAKVAPNSSRPFSIRLSIAERQQLEREAGPQPLGAYVKARLLTNATQRRPGRSFEDTAALGQALGRLGRLRLASSLSDLAAAAKAGAIVITPELEREIQALTGDVRRIRDLLMLALGSRPEART